MSAPVDPFPTETAIDRVRALGDLLVASGGQSLSANTLPAIGGLLFDLADQLDANPPVSDLRHLGDVLADIYDLGSADMEVVETFLRAHRVSGLNMDSASLRASDPDQIRALVGVK